MRKLDTINAHWTETNYSIKKLIKLSSMLFLLFFFNCVCDASSKWKHGIESSITFLGKCGTYDKVKLVFFQTKSVRALHNFDSIESFKYTASHLHVDCYELCAGSNVSIYIAWRTKTPANIFIRDNDRVIFENRTILTARTCFVQCMHAWLAILISHLHLLRSRWTNGIWTATTFTHNSGHSLGLM